MTSSDCPKRKNEEEGSLFEYFLKTKNKKRKLKESRNISTQALFVCQDMLENF
jgi:hypothetical protein